MLTKTNYIIWRDCRKNAWIKVHKPEVYFAHELSAFEKQIIETGNEVELLARELFPTGKLVEKKGEDALEETEKLIAEDEETIFQATFSQNGYFAAIDALKFLGKKKVEIFEIKATNEIDEKTHYNDIAFQVALLKKLGYVVEKACIIHLNRDYTRRGKLELETLFTVEDVTESIEEMLEGVLIEMEEAKSYIEKQEEPKGFCDCIYRGRSAHCTTFAYSNPDIPKYGIHDIARIGSSKKKLTELVDGNKFNLEDIPEDIELSTIQENQIWTHLYDRPIISKEEIGLMLEELVFPLYFLDYETFPSAVPRFDGYHPYEQIPFQYSLHLLESADEEPKHFEFLYTEKGDPSRAFSESLMRHVEDKGSIVVWHKQFECGRNKELAERIPEARNFFAEFDKRVFDLEDIFKDQHYVHKNFKGSSSIKKVLPVLAPTLKYDELTIKEGGTAAESWNRIVTTDLSKKEKEEIIENLKTYCKLDTFAMYAIWRELHKLINP